MQNTSSEGANRKKEKAHWNKWILIGGVALLAVLGIGVASYITRDSNTYIKGEEMVEYLKYDIENGEARNVKENSEAPSNNLVIPEKIGEYPVTEIGEYAFTKQSNAKTIQLPNTVKRIGQSAFYGLTKLKEVILPNGLERIEESTFRKCSTLENAVIPESVTSIGRDAFNGCSSLQVINLPKSLTKLESGVFWECTSLESITIPSTISDLPSSVFYNCDSLKTIFIKSGIEVLGEEEYSTFCYCDNIVEIWLPPTITKICGMGFGHISKMQKVYVEAGSYAETWCNEHELTPYVTYVSDYDKELSERIKQEETKNKMEK